MVRFGLKMPIVSAMSQNEVRMVALLDRFELVLDGGSIVRKVAVAKAQHSYIGARSRRQHFARGAARLALARAGGTEHHPSHFHIRVAGEHRQQRCTTSDLDVIGVRAQTENAQRRARSSTGQRQRSHDRPIVRA